MPIALIEAKDNKHSAGDGMQKGLDCAATLNIPFVFSSNGDGFVFHDRTGQSSTTEANINVRRFRLHAMPLLSSERTFASEAYRLK